MTRAAWLVAAVLAVCPNVALAQQASDGLTDQQRVGLALFNQSCRVCHTKPQLSSPLYGPALSRASLGGQEATMRQVISDGTPRPWRMKVRSPSFINLQALPLMIKGRLIADVIAAIGSIDIVLGEVDR